MNAFSRSWSIILSSWNVLKGRPSLAVLPLAGFVFCAPAIFLVFKGELSIIRYFEGPVSVRTLHLNPFAWAGLAFPYYFACDCVVIFFNAVLADACLATLRGEDISFSDAFGAAWARLPQIVAWSFVCAIVSAVMMVLRGKRRNDIGLGVWFAGLGWRIACYLVIPVLVAQGLGPIGAVRESVALIKKNWGEGLTGGVGLGAVGGIIILGPFLLYGIASQYAHVSGLEHQLAAVYVPYVLLAAVILSTLGMIFRCGLYLYATTGRMPDALAADSVKQAFQP